jgi:2-dehydropantoate 2-reductase
MTVVVLGAGAIGSLYAAKLAAHHRVTVLARPAHAEAITRDGLRLVGRETGTFQVNAVTSLDDVPDADLFLLTTKVNDNASVAGALANRIHRSATVLCVQNGLGGEAIVRDRLGDRAVVLRAVTQFGAIFQAPGLIDYKVEGYTVIERGTGSEELAALLTAAGLGGRVSDRIEDEVWRKLVFNCVINPITSIIGGEVGSIADARLDPLKQLIIDECLAVARASGVPLDFDVIAALRDIFGPSRNIASMRQDLMRGKATEIDYMNGAVVERGRRLGIRCPVNSALVAIIKAMERSGSRREV